MQFDSDVALLGSGLAPLIAASHFLTQGKSVLILNPDRDFFLEDSELPLDPFLLAPGGQSISARRIVMSHPESVLQDLRPFFPGAVEFWSADGAPASGFHDTDAPHVRSRSRVWMPFSEELEEVYVDAVDFGLNPQILDGLQATTRFPGVARPREGERGLLVPRICDVDVSRYRNGVLEFVRERLGPRSMVCAAGQVELMPGGVRFHAGGASRTARIRDGILVFWTPRLTPWVLGHSKRLEVEPVFPLGVRFWEHWVILSRDPLDPGVVGVFKGELTVWAECEGTPSLNRSGLNRLSVLRAGPRLAPGQGAFPEAGVSWASAPSLGSLSMLCHDFLRWDRFTVRSMTPRAIFEWERPGTWSLSGTDDPVRVVCGCDGPLFQAVRNARIACDELERMSA